LQGTQAIGAGDVIFGKKSIAGRLDQTWCGHRSPPFILSSSFLRLSESVLGMCLSRACLGKRNVSTYFRLGTLETKSALISISFFCFFCFHFFSQVPSGVRRLAFNLRHEPAPRPLGVSAARLPAAPGIGVPARCQPGGHASFLHREGCVAVWIWALVTAPANVDDMSPCR
jgi:hypothetical protein